MSTMPAVGIIPGSGKQGYEMLSRGLGESHSTAVLVEVLAVKFCDTDKAIGSGVWAGGPGADGRSLVAGHEISGRVKRILGDKVRGLCEGERCVRVVREPLVYPADGSLPRVDMLPLGAAWREAGIHLQDGGLVPEFVCDYRALVPVRGALPSQHIPFIETASCPLKLLEMGEGVRKALLGMASMEEPHQKQVLVTGATGKSGGIVVKLLQSRGYKVVAVGRGSDDNPKVTRLTSRGVEYRQWSGTNGFAEALKKEFGPFPFIFDLTGNGQWMDALQISLGHTGGILQYAIPSEAQHEPLHDLAIAPRDAVLANKFRLGSVNAGWEHWAPAVEFLDQLYRDDPEFLTAGVHPIDGLDVKAINTALEDPSVIYPMVAPNGLQRWS